jgi:DNA-binding response OmpR family regulator
MIARVLVLEARLIAEYFDVLRPLLGVGLFGGVEGGDDLSAISLGLENSDALRLCSQIRSLERTRNLPVLLIAEMEDRARILRGLILA